jgi:hypothetical protein
MSEKEYIYVEVNQIDQDRQETNGEVHCELKTLLDIIALLLDKTAKEQDEMPLRDMLKYIILQMDLKLKDMEVSESQKEIDQLIDEALRRIDG